MACAVGGGERRVVVEARCHRRSGAGLAGGGAAGGAGRGADAGSDRRWWRWSRSAAGFVVTTDTGQTVTCGQVVNAAGAWAGELAAKFGETVPMFAAGPPLFTVRPEHGYAGPSLHAVDGTLLLRPGRGGKAMAGFFPRVRADLAVRQGRRANGSGGARTRAPGRGGAGPGPPDAGPRVVGHRRLSARHAAGDGLERHDAGPAARVRVLRARLSTGAGRRSDGGRNDCGRESRRRRSMPSRSAGLPAM